MAFLTCIALSSFNPDDKILDANQVDNIVSAQLPDPIEDPLLYETVTTCMLHGPCGDEKPNAPCMVDGKCSRHYPKEFIEHTVYGDNAYPQYAKPNNGCKVRKNGVDYDNRHVIPYNPESSIRVSSSFFPFKKNYDKLIFID